MKKEKIRIENLSFFYFREKTPVLKNISLSVKKGEFLGIAGKTGSGKSTLALCISGLYKYMGGHIKGVLDVEGKVEYVFQNPSSQVFSIRVDNELLMNSSSIQEAYKSAIHTGIFDLLHMRIDRLSEGQKQKVEIASALASSPDILILDEPTSHLDYAGRRSLLKTFSVLKKRGVTLVLIEHDPDILSWMDRIILLDNGGIVFSASPKEVFSRTWFAPFVSRLARKLAKKLSVSGESLPYTIEEFVSFFPVPPRHELKRQKKSPGKELLRFVRVWFRYGRKSPFVLKNVNFSIRGGEDTALLGPNGSGKSTIARLAIGLSKPTMGDVLVSGKNTRKTRTEKIVKKVGLVFQNPRYQLFLPTVLEECMFGPRNIGMPPEEARKVCISILESVGLRDFLNRDPLELSEGQARRLAIASVLAMSPELLILDEPTAGLDPESVDQLFSLIRSLPVTKLIITHDIDVALETAERIIYLDRGQVKFNGSREEFARLSKRGTVPKIAALLHINASNSEELLSLYDPR